MPSASSASYAAIDQLLAVVQRLVAETLERQAAVVRSRLVSGDQFVTQGQPLLQGLLSIGIVGDFAEVDAIAANHPCPAGSAVDAERKIGRRLSRFSGWLSFGRLGHVINWPAKVQVVIGGQRAVRKK